MTEALDSAALLYCEPTAVVCILVRGPETRDLSELSSQLLNPWPEHMFDLKFPHNCAITLYPSSLPRIVSLVFGTPVQVACAEVGVVMRTCKSLGAPTGTVKVKVNRLVLKQYWVQDESNDMAKARFIVFKIEVFRFLSQNCRYIKCHS